MKNSNIKISKSSVLNLINDYISLRINRLDAFPSIDMINHAAYQLLQLCKIQGIKYVNEITLHGTCAKNHILFDVFSKEKCINYLAGINVDTKTILPNTVFVSFSMSVDSIIKQILEEYKKGYAKAELDLKREPMTGSEISHGFRDDKDAINAESYWAGVELAEKAHGIGVDDET